MIKRDGDCMDKSILVVDDEPQILNALKRALRKQDYSVFYANNGEEAIEILKQQEVALIMSDYMMPGLSGTELLTEAEKIQPNTIRIILSGHSDFQTVLQSIKHGVVHKFLAKPWVNEVLIEQINKALESGAYPEENGDTPAASLISKEEKAVQDDNQDGNQVYEIQISEDNEIIEISEELAGFLGYDAEELSDEGLSMLFADHSYEQHLGYVEELNESADSWELPVKKRIAQTKDLHFLPVELSVCYSSDKNVCLIKFVDDPVKGKGLDSILNSIHGPYILIDKAGTIKRFNQKLVDLYGDFEFPEMCEPLQDFITGCVDKGAFPSALEDKADWYDKFSQFNEENSEHMIKENTWIKIKATHAPKGARILLHFDISQKKQQALS